MAQSALHISSSPPAPPQSPPSPPLPQSPTNQENKPTLTNSQTKSSPTNTKNYTLLLAVNYACLIVGSVSATLLTKFYFIHNGSSRWVSTWIQTAGFPLLIPPVLLPYYLLHSTPRRPFSGFTTNLLALSIVVGIFIGVSNLLFSWGTSYLPVSTSSLLLSSQLIFNLILSALIVKQKVTFNNLNCVVLLTVSSVLLGLSESSDRPPGLTRGKYWVGFFATLGAGLSFAVYLPVMERIYRRVYCYSMVMEMQLITGVAATAFAAAGMAADGGFSDLKAESVGFDKGTASYWWTIFGNMVVWQLSFLGTAGMVFLTTSLTGGICMTALMAVNVVAGVAVYGDAFGGVKAVAAAVCVWGFCSYLYGMYVKKRKKQNGGEDGCVDMNEVVVNT